MKRILTRTIPPTLSVPVLPNSSGEVDRRIQSGEIGRSAPWLILPLRAILFALIQASLAVVFALAGRPDPWSATIRWWPVYLIAANAITFAVLIGLIRREGLAYRDLWRFVSSPGSPAGWRELLTWTILLLVGLPVAASGFFGASVLFYGGQMPDFVGPLPLWAALLALGIMPVSIALVELPAYLGYALPRLEVLTRRRWLPLLLVAFWLALQHSTLPLMFDSRFILYRFLSMAPLALYLGLVYQHTRRLFPLMVLHFLADLQLGVTVFMLSLAG